MQEETNDQLKWFEDVEKFYGSVEKSSLTRAQEINERGVYSISKKKREFKTTLDNSMRLALPEDGSQGNKKFKVHWQQLCPCCANVNPTYDYHLCSGRWTTLLLCGFFIEDIIKGSVEVEMLSLICNALLSTCANRPS